MSESGVLVVLPVIADYTADACVASLLMPRSAAGIDPADILVVDNTREGWAHKYGLRTYRDPDGHNLGVARAWNVGAREVLDRNLEYLIVMSASMRFGPEMHTTWLAQMHTFWGEHVIECEGNSWHLIAFHRSTFEKIGLFDPAFYPGYVEGVDFSRRLQMVGLEGAWPHVWVNAMSQTVGAHSSMCRGGALLAYYDRKWGGPKMAERYTLPFGDKPLDFIIEEPIPVLAERYGLGEYGVGWW